MGLRAGDTAPDFELPDETGTPRRLSDLLAGGTVVLFFYPAAMTRGCTAESCHFRDLTAELRAAGGQPVGISHDTVARQREFSQAHGFEYPLLSDVGGQVAARYGVRRPAFLPDRRQTFVIDSDGTILAVWHSEVKMQSHADAALALLRSRAS